MVGGIFDTADWQGDQCLGVWTFFFRFIMIVRQLEWQRTSCINAEKCPNVYFGNIQSCGLYGSKIDESVIISSEYCELSKWATHLLIMIIIGKYTFFFIKCTLLTKHEIQTL